MLRRIVVASSGRSGSRPIKCLNETFKHSLNPARTKVGLCPSCPPHTNDTSVRPDMLRRMATTRKECNASSRIGGAQHLRPLQQMSHDRERAECSQDESIWKTGPDRLRDCRLIVKVSHFDYVCPLGQHSIGEKTARKNEPATGHESLSQSNYACWQRCCQRKSDREDFRGAVIRTDCERTANGCDAAPQAAKNS